MSIPSWKLKHKTTYSHVKSNTSTNQRWHHDILFSSTKTYPPTANPSRSMKMTSLKHIVYNIVMYSIYHYISYYTSHKGFCRSLWVFVSPPLEHWQWSWACHPGQLRTWKATAWCQPGRWGPQTCGRSNASHQRPRDGSQTALSTETWQIQIGQSLRQSSSCEKRRPLFETLNKTASSWYHCPTLPNG